MTKNPRPPKRIAVRAAMLTIGTLSIPAPAAAHPANAIIDNGTIQLGVWDEGHLNVPGGAPSSQTGTTNVGLRYLPTGAEATAPGCLCEGWGAADAISGVSGHANEDIGVTNLSVVSFNSTATTAQSVVDVGTTLRVTHDYHPSPDTPNLYEVDVSVENLSAAAVDLRYRRVMDWDVEPTAFNEFSTIQGTAGATNVLFSSNNGFASADPLSGPSDRGATGDFVDVGPTDHGALFDFGFGNLDPGASRSFRIFYGAAGNESDALAALAAAGAEVYSFGQPSSSDPAVGEPNTFIFAFAGVGGDPIGDPDPCLEPTISGTDGADTIFGTAGNDVIDAGGGNDVVHGLAGNDVICGRDGNDEIDGGSGNDDVYGDSGRDQVSGGSGDDLVSGGAGNDRVLGDSGKDQVLGGDGDDQLAGGTDKKDTCDGGAGNDATIGSKHGCEKVIDIP
jgi:Ca2+-binding RTX toxin-like protein